MQEREPGTLLKALLQALNTKGVGIHHALFVPPDSRYTNVSKHRGGHQLDLRWQLAIRNKWEAYTRDALPSEPKVSSVRMPGAGGHSMSPCLVPVTHMRRSWEDM